MTDDERDTIAAGRVARIRLASVPGVSPRLAARLLARFGSAETALAAAKGDVMSVRGLSTAHAALLASAPSAEEGRAALERAERAGASVLCPGDEAWPAALDELSDPPLLLFVRGDLLAHDRRGVAIVGSRRATRYGLAQAARLAGELAALGITVVSGLARGIDAAAHRGALRAGGRTVAVLGSGLCRLYPPEHVTLARDITAGRGAVLSEFPLDAPPMPYHFPRRNRLLAALAVAVVVVEAGERSGSLITADHALDIGREVLAVPGRVDSANSRGVHRLLREGAALCGGADDVLRALGIDPPDAPTDAPAGAAASDRARDAPQRRLLDALAGEERHADELLEQTGLDPAAGLAALSALELRGVVVLGRDGRYGLA